MPETTVTLNPLGSPTHHRPAPAPNTNGRCLQLPRGPLIGHRLLPLSQCVLPLFTPRWGWRGWSISASSCEQPRQRRRVVAVAPSVRSRAGWEGGCRGRGGGVAASRKPPRPARRPAPGAEARLPSEPRVHRRPGARRFTPRTEGLPGRTQSRRPRRTARRPPPAPGRDPAARPGTPGAAPWALSEGPPAPGPAEEPPETLRPRQRRAGRGPCEWAPEPERRAGKLPGMRRGAAGMLRRRWLTAPPRSAAPAAGPCAAVCWPVQSPGRPAGLPASWPSSDSSLGLAGGHLCEVQPRGSAGMGGPFPRPRAGRGV